MSSKKPWNVTELGIFRWFSRSWHISLIIFFLFWDLFPPDAIDCMAVILAPVSNLVSVVFQPLSDKPRAIFVFVTLEIFLDIFFVEHSEVDGKISGISKKPSLLHLKPYQNGQRYENDRAMAYDSNDDDSTIRSPAQYRRPIGTIVKIIVLWTQNIAFELNNSFCKEKCHDIYDLEEVVSISNGTKSNNRPFIRPVIRADSACYVAAILLAHVSIGNYFTDVENLLDNEEFRAGSDVACEDAVENELGSAPKGICVCYGEPCDPAKIEEYGKYQDPSLEEEGFVIERGQPERIIILYWLIIARSW